MVLGLTKQILIIDVESSSPVNIKKQGQHIYWADPETRVLMVGYKVLLQQAGWGSLTPVTAAASVIDLERAEYPGDLPPWMIEVINAPKEEFMLAAANAPFDQAALRTIGFDTPDDKWLDVLTMAYVLGFAGRLDDVLKQTPLGIKKNPAGTRCITEFCVKRTPWHENPTMWGDFLAYCRDDADVEERLLRWCLRWLDTPGMAPIVRKVHEQDLIYRRINRRGIPVDRDAVNGALAIVEQETERLMDTLRDATGLANPNSVSQLLAWCREQGSKIENLQKATVRDELQDLPPGDLRTALECRAELGKTSVTKFAALERQAGQGDRLRGGWQFYGASRTGRVAGRALNPANLARPQIEDPESAVEFAALGDSALLGAMFPEKPVLDTLSSCIRASLKAPPGKRWCVADLTSIESIGAAWMAGCDKILDIFFDGKDTYRAFAAEAEGIDYDAVTKKQRTFYKPCVLGATYMLSGRGLVTYGEGYGVDLERAEADRQIAVFRDTYHEVKQHWYNLKDAAVGAVLNPGIRYPVFAVDRVLEEQTDERTGRVYRAYAYKENPKVVYMFDGTFLFCVLPSGRRLCYYKPEVERDHQVCREDGSPWFKTDSLSYMGVNQKGHGNQWQRIFTHGGKLLENNNQALCRDIMWHGLERAEADPWLEVIGDVYDELLCLAPAADTGALERLITCMTTRPPWTDKRFFLGADGYVAGRYRKD